MADAHLYKSMLQLIGILKITYDAFGRTISTLKANYAWWTDNL